MDKQIVEGDDFSVLPPIVVRFARWLRGDRERKDTTVDDGDATGRRDAEPDESTR